MVVASPTAAFFPLGEKRTQPRAMTRPTVKHAQKPGKKPKPKGQKKPKRRREEKTRQKKAVKSTRRVMMYLK